VSADYSGDPEPLVMTVWNDDMLCTECNSPIPAGNRFVFAWYGRVRHEGRCPAAWTPVLIRGGQPEQLHLPLEAT
jgi:hypothetical protein